MKSYFTLITLENNQPQKEPGACYKLNPVCRGVINQSECASCECCYINNSMLCPFLDIFISVSKTCYFFTGQPRRLQFNRITQIRKGAFDELTSLQSL